jgi:hypothetical protein
VFPPKLGEVCAASPTHNSIQFIAAEGFAILEGISFHGFQWVKVFSVGSIYQCGPDPSTGSSDTIIEAQVGPL